MDGDGLADKLFKDGGLKFYKNITEPGSTDIKFAILDTDLQSVSGIGTIGRTRTRSSSRGNQGFAFGGTAQSDSSSTTTRGSLPRQCT